jgi:hypothetical protein
MPTLCSWLFAQKWPYVDQHTAPFGARSIGNPYRVQAHQGLDVLRKPKYIRGRTLARLGIDFSSPALHAKSAVATDVWRSQPLA